MLKQLLRCQEHPEQGEFIKLRIQTSRVTGRGMLMSKKFRLRGDYKYKSTIQDVYHCPVCYKEVYATDIRWWNWRRS